MSGLLWSPREGDANPLRPLPIVHHASTLLFPLEAPRNPHQHLTGKAITKNSVLSDVAGNPGRLWRRRRCIVCHLYSVRRFCLMLAPGWIFSKVRSAGISGEDKRLPFPSMTALSNPTDHTQLPISNSRLSHPHKLHTSP